MSIILLPYHLDEHLAGLETSFATTANLTTVTVPLPDGDLWARLGTLYGAVADEVEAVTRAGQVPVVVSGDCTASFGTVAGLQRAGVDPAIVWLDAHGDVQTLETTTSGYVGGMPLRILVGYRPGLISERLGLRAIPESHALLVGARDLDPAEMDYLATAEIGRSSVEELSVRALPAGPLLLHLDLDVVDPDDLPGLRYPAPGGPGASSVLDAVRLVLDTGRVAALDIGCTWYPDGDDPEGKRARIVEALIPH